MKYDQALAAGLPISTGVVEGACRYLVRDRMYALVMTWSEHVHPHGSLELLLPGLWQVTGALPRTPVPRNMQIWSSARGLCLHTAVALDEPGMAALEQLGELAVLIVPCPIHRSDVAVFKQRYPQLEIVCPRRSPRRSRRSCPSIARPRTR